MFGFGKKKIQEMTPILGDDLSEVVRASEDRWLKLFLSVREGVSVHEMIFDENGKAINYRLIDVNPAFEAITGLKRGEVMGKLATEVYKTKEPPFLNDYARAIQDKELIIFETFFNPMDKYFSVSVVTLDSNSFATVFSDITNDRKQQQLVRSSEQRLRVVFEHSPDGLYVRRLDGTIVEVNHAALTMLGYTREEMINKNLDELQVEREADINRVGHALQELKPNELSQPIQVELRKKDGSQFIAEVRVAPIVNENEKLLFGMIQNLSAAQQKQAEFVQFKQAIEQSGDVVMMLDLKGTMTYVNQEFVDFYGYTRDEVVGVKTPQILKAGGMSLAELMEFAKVLHMGKILRQEFTNITKDGRTVSVLSTSSAILNEEHKPVGALVIQQDLTVQKEIEGKVQQLSRAVEQSPASVVITSVDGTIEYVNEKFCEITGYTESEAIGKNPRILKYGDTSSETYQALWKVITEGGEWRGELHNKKKSGEEFWEKASISAIKNKEGKVINFLAVKEDITEEKNAEIARHRRIDRMKKQDETIIAIAKLINQQNLSIDQLIQRIVIVSCEVLEVQRVSNWKLSRDKTKLEMMDRYDRFEAKHSSGEVLEVDTISKYMAALSSDRAIRASDALTDERTVEFVPYLKENKITSLLDAPIRVSGMLTGVLCVETGDKREWTDDEVRFVSEMADQLSQALINYEKLEMMQKLEQRTRELERLNQTMIGRELKMIELKKENKALKGTDV